VVGEQTERRVSVLRLAGCVQGAGGHGAARLFCSKSENPLMMKWDFWNEKGSDEMKFHFQNGKGAGASVFCVH